MVTSIVSVLTGIPVRKDIAMTGEVTLRGNVLGIGGLKEKLLAALRGGVTTVLIPQENAKDLPEIPDNVKAGLTIIPVSHVSQVLEHALVRAPSPSNGTRPETAAAEAAAKAVQPGGGAATVAH
jgi:ATP-dependent Lon protease